MQKLMFLLFLSMLAVLYPGHFEVIFYHLYQKALIFNAFDVSGLFYHLCKALLIREQASAGATILSFVSLTPSLNTALLRLIFCLYPGLLLAAGPAFYAYHKGKHERQQELLNLKLGLLRPQILHTLRARLCLCMLPFTLLCVDYHPLLNVLYAMLTVSLYAHHLGVMSVNRTDLGFDEKSSTSEATLSPDEESYFTSRYEKPVCKQKLSLKKVHELTFVFQVLFKSFKRLKWDLYMKRFLCVGPAKATEKSPEIKELIRQRKKSQHNFGDKRKIR